VLILYQGNVVAECHIFGAAHPGGYDPQIQTLLRFLYNAPTPEFRHSVFTLSEVIMLTDKHKQMLLQTSSTLRYATTLGNDVSL